MPSPVTRAVGFLCLVGTLVACHSPEQPCISGKVRPRPIYVAPEAFCALEGQIDGLNHRFASYEAAMDRCALPKRVCQRLIQIDNDLQHVNAEMISREVAPEKVARQLVHIEADLSWVKEKIRVVAPPDACCKDGRAMTASLDAQLAAQRDKNPPKIPNIQ